MNNRTTEREREREGGESDGKRAFLHDDILPPLSLLRHVWKRCSCKSRCSDCKLISLLNVLIITASNMPPYVLVPFGDIFSPSSSSTGPSAGLPASVISELAPSPPPFATDRCPPSIVVTAPMERRRRRRKIPNSKGLLQIRAIKTLISPAAPGNIESAHHWKIR